MGGAIQADDLRTTAASLGSIYKQDDSFASDSYLKFNTTKFLGSEDFSLLSWHGKCCCIYKVVIPASPPQMLQSVSECGGTQAYPQFLITSTRPEELFFALWRLGAVQGDLNPLQYFRNLYHPNIIIRQWGLVVGLHLCWWYLREFSTWEWMPRFARCP